METTAAPVLPGKKTKTISVLTRHGALKGQKGIKCPHAGKPDYKKCHCPKAFYIYENGKQRGPISAGTRSWETAEADAKKIRDGWDPVQRELKAAKAALAQKRAEEELGQVKIEYALEQ